eukprot:365702-Chlamydomonas_euryale.AAC.27
MQCSRGHGIARERTALDDGRDPNHDGHGLVQLRVCVVSGGETLRFCCAVFRHGANQLCVGASAGQRAYGDLPSPSPGATGGSAPRPVCPAASVAPRQGLPRKHRRLGVGSEGWARCHHRSALCGDVTYAAAAAAPPRCRTPAPTHHAQVDEPRRRRLLFKLVAAPFLEQRRGLYSRRRGRGRGRRGAQVVDGQGEGRGAPAAMASPTSCRALYGQAGSPRALGRCLGGSSFSRGMRTTHFMCAAPRGRARMRRGGKGRGRGR